MRPTVSLIIITLHALLSGTSSSGDDRRLLVASVDLVEMEYEDHCENRAYATWKELIGDPKGLSVKLEKDKVFGILSRQQKNDVKVVLGGYNLEPSDEVLRRKVQLLLQPGDTLLETEQWIRLVTFGDTALHKLRYSNDFDCGTGSNCTLRELHNSIARQEDEETLLRMKKSWERNLPSLNEYLEQILPLLRNASKENSYNGVEEYWDSLVEYEGAILKARELWDNVKPLYLKLHKYIALRLKGPEAVGEPLPVHLLRTLNGDDWSNIIESLLPKHPVIYQKIHANIQLKELGGAKALGNAIKLINDLGFGEIETDLSKSVFNGTCPPTLVDWCKPNKIMIATCKDVSIGNYIDAHETAMEIRYKEIAALHSNNTYILREAPRYSAIYEGIPGFVSLLALNPHALDRNGLFPFKIFSYNPNHHRLVLQLIMALRDLPKLNYYLAADEWRLKVLMGSIAPSKVASSWSEFRKNFSLLETSDVDILGDPQILFNKPFIGKFMGLILKYQIYQSFAEELSSDESDLLQQINETSGRLSDVMMQGFSSIWTEMVRDMLSKKENGLEYTGLTDYYRLLDEYLDKQLEPSDGEVEDDYNEPVEEITEDNVIPPPPSSGPPLIHELDVMPPDESENIIDVDDTHLKYSAETSTVGVLEIKKQPPVVDTKNSQEASYNTYWWIGIVVALIIIVILVAIIARKRHNHRKQLEKQRRENTRA